MDCTHEWREALLWPNVRECASCHALRDVAPQHHLYEVLMDPVSRKLQKIDVALIPLMRELWRAGVRTTGSCQGGCATELRAKVEFSNDDLVAALEVAADLPGARLVALERVSILYFEAPSVCPMRAVEEELKESGLTPRIHAV